MKSILTEIRTLFKQQSNAREFSPVDLGLSNVNLKASNGTQYNGTIINTQDFTAWLVDSITTVTGSPSTGTFRFGVDFLNADGSLIGNVDILSGCASNAALTDNHDGAVLGQNFAATKLRGSTASVFPSNIGCFRLAAKMRFYIAVQTASNGTLATASLRVFARP